MSGREGRRIEPGTDAAARRRVETFEDKLAEARKRRLKSLSQTPVAANVTHAARRMRDPDYEPSASAESRRRPVMWAAMAALLLPLFALAWIARPEGGIGAPDTRGPASPVASDRVDTIAAPGIEAAEPTEIAELAAPAPGAPAPLPAATIERAPQVFPAPRPLMAEVGPVSEPEPAAPPPGLAAMRRPPPRPLAASARPAPDSPDDAGAPSIAAVETGSDAQPVLSRMQAVPVVFHVPTRTPPDIVSALRDAAVGAGFELGEARRQGVTIRQSNVRFFHPADRPAAARLAAAAGAELRDFTNYRPSPPEGTIEFWAEGSAPEVTRQRGMADGVIDGLRRDLDGMRRGLAGAIRSIGD